MRILFACRHYLPALGGLQLSTHQLAERLRGRGHAVAVLTQLDANGTSHALLLRARRRLNRAAFLEDHELGYPRYRAQLPREGLAAARERFRPDVLVVNGGGVTTLEFSRALLRAADALPTVLYVRDRHSVELAGSPVPADLILCNAAHLAALTDGRQPGGLTIPSLVELDAYRTASTRRTVLFVNPVPSKGMAIAWALAVRRADVPFVFQEAWPRTAAQRRALRARAARRPNIEVREARPGAGALYADARVLLAPYSAGEARPRVVLEAQASGIPILGSRVPGVAEATGSGGVLVGLDEPVEAWIAALGALWDEPGTYERYAAAARCHARRDEIQPACVAARVEAALGALLDRRRAVPLRADQI